MERNRLRELIRTLSKRAPFWVLATLGLTMAGGCCSLSKLGPCDENQLAAREMARLGLDAMQQGKHDEARARLTHALELYPCDPEARHHLAQLEWQCAEYDKALENMQVAVENSAGDPEWQVAMGQMYQAAGNLEKAVACADEALDDSVDLAEAWLLRANILATRHAAAEAKQSFHRCLSCESLSAETQVDASLGLAELYRLEGRPLRALATLERCHRSLPEDQRASVPLAYERAIALHALGRFGDATEQFNVVLAAAPDHQECLLMLADCRFRSGDIAAAQALAMRLEELAPRDDRVAALRANLRSGGHAIAERR